MRMRSGRDIRHLLTVLRWVITDWHQRGEGWNWQPGACRCHEGWTDTAGHNYGCMEAGVMIIDGKFLCRYHALLADAAKVGTPSW